MEKKLEQIQLICEKLDTRIDSMDQTLTRNTVILDEHVRRTSLLEDDFRTRIPPLERHVVKATFIVKVLPWILGVASTVLAFFSH